MKKNIILKITVLFVLSVAIIISIISIYQRNGENNVIDITLKSDGTGNFSTLKSALESTKGASAKKQYVIHIYEGDYDVFNGYSKINISDVNFVGPRLKDYVSIVGEGDYKKIKLIGRLDSTIYDIATQNRVSPLNLSSINNIENVTVIGKNTRYSIHDDFNTPGLKAKRKYKNVLVYKESGNGLTPAYGAGSRNGAYYEFDNFIAISEIGTPFALHNFSKLTDKCVFKLNKVECHNLSSKDKVPLQSKFSIEFPSEMSNTKDELIMTDCYIPDGIYSFAHMDKYGMNKTGQIDFVIKGGGNTIAPNLIQSSDVGQYYIEFNEEVTRHIANSKIVKGQPLKSVGDGKVAPMTASDSSNSFIGVALTDTLVGEEVVTRYKGYLHISDTSLSKINIGDKIGIVNGSLAVVTSGDHIGECTVADYILLH